MLESCLRRCLEKTAAPTPLAERWLNRRPGTLFRHMGAGAALGAGGTAAVEAAKGEMDPSDVGMGAVVGAMGGLGYANGARDSFRHLTGREEVLNKMRAQRPWFGRQEHAQGIKDLEHEIYNVGMREYMKRGLRGAVDEAIMPIAAYHAGKAVGGRGDARE